MIHFFPKLAWKELLWMVLRIIILVYVGLGVFLFLFQRSYIYFPQYTDFPVFSSCPFYTSQEKIDHQGTKFYKAEGVKDAVIIYYHGNAGTACDRVETRELLASTGAILLFVEYPGYGGDEQKTTEESIIHTVDRINDYLRENYTEETEIIVIGRSIGTGAATYHAQQGGVDDLVLISPFTSLDAVAQLHYKVYPASLLVKDHFDNVEQLNDYGDAVTIIHGARDKIVPQKLGSALYEGLQTPYKEFVSIRDGDHNNLMEIEEFRTVLRDHINTVIID